MSLSLCSHCGAPYGLAPAGMTANADRCSYCGTRRIEDAPRGSRIANVQRLVAQGILTSATAVGMLGVPMLDDEIGAVWVLR